MIKKRENGHTDSEILKIWLWAELHFASPIEQVYLWIWEVQEDNWTGLFLPQAY